MRQGKAGMGDSVSEAKPEALALPAKRDRTTAEWQDLGTDSRRYERLPRSVFRNHACPVAPELVIEIIFPDQTFKQLEVVLNK